MSDLFTRLGAAFGALESFLGFNAADPAQVVGALATEAENIVATVNSPTTKPSDVPGLVLRGTLVSAAVHSLTASHPAIAQMAEEAAGLAGTVAEVVGAAIPGAAPIAGAVGEALGGVVQAISADTKAG